MRDIWQRLATLRAVASPRRARAAVLVPLYEDPGGDVRVILTKRPQTMRTHPGDVVFPGGRLEPGESPFDGALREASEEIGLGPDGVEAIGGLQPITTRDPRNLIVPVVARVRRPDVFTLEPSEVEAVLEPRLVDLLDDDAWRTSRWLGHLMWFYDFPEGVMWGATAFMMRELLAVVRPGEPTTVPDPDFDIRPMTDGDLGHVRRTLYIAATWSPAREAPPLDVALEIPYLAQFHDEWGRAGDFGVVAVAGDEYLGGAYGRLFDDEQHAHGYVDPQTPEIAVGVESQHRGQRLGGRLLIALEDVARDRGYGRLSLSVELANPAIRLYERLGYRELDRDTTAMRMVKQL